MNVLTQLIYDLDLTRCDKASRVLFAEPTHDLISSNVTVSLRKLPPTFKYLDNALKNLDVNILVTYFIFRIDGKLFILSIFQENVFNANSVIIIIIIIPGEGG